MSIGAGRAYGAIADLASADGGAARAASARLAPWWAYPPTPSHPARIALPPLHGRELVGRCAKFESCEDWQRAVPSRAAVISIIV